MIVEVSLKPLVRVPSRLFIGRIRDPRPTFGAAIAVGTLAMPVRGSALATAGGRVLCLERDVTSVTASVAYSTASCPVPGSARLTTESLDDGQLSCVVTDSGKPVVLAAGRSTARERMDPVLALHTRRNSIMRNIHIARRPKVWILAVTASVSLCLFDIAALAHSRSAAQHVLTIETRIDPSDPQAGMKSKHRISLNLRSKTIRQHFETGTTKIFEKTLYSIRDNFKNKVVKWYRTADHRAVRLSVSGHTASGVRVLPGIDYKFTVTIVDTGQVAIDGCHDGYPSYLIKIGGTTVYHHRHKPTRLYKLFGKCDVNVRVRTTGHHGWGF